MTKPTPKDMTLSEEMVAFIKKMEDIRILKYTFAFKKSTAVRGYECIEYVSEEILNQARAMALIMNFQIRVRIDASNNIYELWIKM